MKASDATFDHHRKVGPASFGGFIMRRSQRRRLTVTQGIADGIHGGVEIAEVVAGQPELKGERQKNRISFELVWRLKLLEIASFGQKNLNLF